MSLVQQVLYTLSNYPGGYRIIYDILYDGLPPGKRKKFSERTLSATLSRMKSKGLVSRAKNEWQITPEGRDYLNTGGKAMRVFPYHRIDFLNRPKKLIIIFDIPEKRRKYRDWLRLELISLGFEMIQKSVWFGPELPKEFLAYLDEVGILKYLRFFRAKEEDLI